jgi:hypothetical protein
MNRAMKKAMKKHFASSGARCLMATMTLAIAFGMACTSHAQSDSKNKPLCKMSDIDVHLVDGHWVGPKCIAVDGDGKPVHPEEVKKPSSDADDEKHAAEIESHSCMTTDGADKANALAADCEKVTSAPHKDCNIQQNTCDQIRKATQKGCWGKGAEGPDWCLTRYN